MTVGLEELPEGSKLVTCIIEVANSCHVEELTCVIVLICLTSSIAGLFARSLA